MNQGHSDQRPDNMTARQYADAAATRASREVEQTLRASREIAEQASRFAQESAEQTLRAAGAAAEQSALFEREAMDVGRESAAQANRLGRETAEASERAVRASADVIAHNADAMQRAFQSGLSLATQLSEQSLEQIVRIFDLAGERTKEASKHSSRHVEAIMQSSTVLSGGLEAISREWIDFAQKRVTRQRACVTQVLHARTPQDLAVIQTEMLRDNIESFLQSCRRLAEVSARLTEDAVKKLADDAERTARAA
jgi:hypothetical protein